MSRDPQKLVESYGAGESDQSRENAYGPSAGSSDIDVALHDHIVMLPFRIREIRSSSDQDQRPPLQRWVDKWTPAGSPWQDEGPFFPFDQPAQRSDQQPTRYGDAYDRIRYSEYVYFHPFVRSFLYPTTEDRFHQLMQSEEKGTTMPGPPPRAGESREQQRNIDGDATADSRQDVRQRNKPDVENRSVRALKRDDVRWAVVFVRDNSKEKLADAEGKPEIKIYVLRVRRIECQLFETRIGFLTVEFDNRLGLSGETHPEFSRFDSRDDIPDIHLGIKDHWIDEQTRDQAYQLNERLTALKENDQLEFKYIFPETTKIGFDEVLLLQNMLRRGYAPYWEFDPVLARAQPRLTSYSVGKSVEAVFWLDRHLKPISDFKSWGVKKSLCVELSDSSKLWDDPSQLFRSVLYDGEIEQTRQTGVPQLFPWWQELMAPCRPLDGKRDPQDSLSSEEAWYHHVLDYPSQQTVTLDGKSQSVDAMLQAKAEFCYYSLLGDDRFPCMTYLAVDDPRRLELGHWMRLAFADGPGRSKTQRPYSDLLWDIDPGAYSDTNQREAHVRERFRRQYCYDRFFLESDHPLAETEGETTRYLNSGEVFVAVGSYKERRQIAKTSAGRQIPTKSFAIDPVNGLLAHFRYHYFKLGLIVHFHRCSLLNFEEELSIAVSEKLGKPDDPDIDDDNFRRMVVRVRRELIKFRLRFWFREVSGQMQARDLFQMWSGQLGNEQLFDQVNEQLNEAEEILNRWSDQRQAESERRKNGFFALAAVIGFPAAFYGLLDDAARWESRLAIGLITSLLVYLAWVNGDWTRIGDSFRYLFRWETPDPITADRHKTGWRTARIVFALLAVCFFVGGMHYCSRDQPGNAKPTKASPVEPAAEQPALLEEAPARENGQPNQAESELPPLTV